MKTAVIKTGGKQYVVHEGDTMVVDRMVGKEGDSVTFSEVLLVSDGKKVEIGTPLVKGATVTAKLAVQGRLPKVTGVKMKAKKRNSHYFGHKQHITQVEIEKITVKSK